MVDNETFKRCWVLQGVLGPLVQNVVDWWYTGDGGDGGKVGPYQFWVGNGSSGSETDQTYIRSPTIK